MKLAIALITLLAAMLLLAGMKDVDPGMVTVHWKDWTVAAPGTVVVLSLALALVVAYFFGVLVEWVKHLPGRISAFVTGRHQNTTLALLAEAMSARVLGEIKKSNKALAKARPSEQERPLYTLLRITNHMTAAELETFTGNPLFGPLACLSLARISLREGNWAKVRDLTATGLQQAPGSPRLLVLHMKALVNLGETAAAAAMLEELKPLVTKPTQPLLAGALKPGATPPQADHPWYKAFTQWLTTTSEIIPEASLYVPGKKTAADAA